MCRVLWAHSLRLAACAVIPADAGIQKPDWMPDQVRHDAEYPAACGGVVYFWGLQKRLTQERGPGVLFFLSNSDALKAFQTVRR